jgi:hypothetical protein
MPSQRKPFRAALKRMRKDLAREVRRERFIKKRYNRESGKMSSKRTEAIQAALEQIRKRHKGRITRKMVVDAARRKDSPLHRYFEWNDTKAAEKYRLDQAQELITRYVVVVVVDKAVKVTVPLYVSDPRAMTKDGGYVAITSEEITRNDAQQIVLTELGRCESSVARARSVAGALNARFPGLSAQLQRMLEELINMRQKLAA